LRRRGHDPHEIRVHRPGLRRLINRTH
jgi:hypothetical protein